MVAKKKRNRKRANIKNLLFYAFSVVFGLSLVVFLVATNWKIYQKREELTDRIEKLTSEIELLENKNKQLKDNASYAESEDYLEQVAREQLDLKKPGEEVVVIQKEEAVEPVPEEKKSWWEKIKGLWARD